MRVLADILIEVGLRQENVELPRLLIQKYEPFSESVETDLNIISLYIDTPAYSELKNELKGNRLRVSETQKVVFSQEDYDEAEFLILESSSRALDPYKKEFDTFFCYSCPDCKVYIHQHSDYKIKKKDVGKKDFFETFEIEYCVSPRAKDLLEKEDATGLSYRPVTVEGEDEPVAYQVVPANILPPLHSKTDLRTSVRTNHYGITCETCGFQSFTMGTHQPMYFSNKMPESAADFNLTHEYFGTQSFPKRVRIVSQRVRQLFLKHKIKGVRFTPVMLVEEE